MILWGERLGFIDTSMIDPKGINYVYHITTLEDDSSRVVMMIQTRNNGPLGFTFEIDTETFDSLIEKFEVE